MNDRHMARMLSVRALLLALALQPGTSFVVMPGRASMPARRDGVLRQDSHCAASSVRMSAKEEPGGASSSWLSVLCPLLKLVANSDPTAPRNKGLETATTGFASMARLPWGSKVSPQAAARAQKPAQPIRLYEFEACPFCRRVREAATFLDLEVAFASMHVCMCESRYLLVDALTYTPTQLEVYPCPKSPPGETGRHRTEVLQRGGKETFPFLVDLNSGPDAQGMYESADIVKYLFETYGEGAEMPPYLLESTLLTGWMPTLLRAGRGMSKFERAMPPPPQLLQLYSYENNQFCRLVREALCELELPYTLINAGTSSRAARIPYVS